MIDFTTPVDGGIGIILLNIKHVSKATGLFE